MPSARHLRPFVLRGLVVGAGMVIPAFGLSAAARGDPLAEHLLPWWLLGVTLILVGGRLRQLSAVPEPVARPARADLPDDLTIPLPRSRQDAVAVVITASDDLTLPLSPARTVRDDLTIPLRG
jgi:hypothetical protein